MPTQEELQLLIAAGAVVDAALDTRESNGTGATLEAALTEANRLAWLNGRVIRDGLAGNEPTVEQAAAIKRSLRTLRRKLNALKPFGHLLTNDTSNIVDAVEAWALTIAPDPVPEPEPEEEA